MHFLLNESLKGAAAVLQILCLEPVASTDFSVTCFGKSETHPGVSWERDGIVGVSCAGSGAGLYSCGFLPIQDVLWICGSRSWQHLTLLRRNQGPNLFSRYIKLPFHQILLANTIWI